MSGQLITGQIEYETHMVVLLPFDYRGVHLLLRAYYSTEIDAWVAHVARGDFEAASMDSEDPDEALADLAYRIEDCIDLNLYAQEDQDEGRHATRFSELGGEDEVELPFGWHIFADTEYDENE